jgi:hypothetical protein
VKHILERDRDARSKAHDVQLPAAARARQSRRCQKRIVVVLPSCAERYLSTAFFEKFATIENHPRSLPVITAYQRKRLGADPNGSYRSWLCRDF